MNQLTDIPIVIEEKDGSVEHASIQTRALLEELSTLIGRLISKNESGYIDVRSIPLLPGEIEFLKKVLGAGEVKATIDALGVTKVLETAIPSVWWISNFNANDELISELIEVSLVPEIMKTQHLDLHDANDILNDRMREYDVF